MAAQQRVALRNFLYAGSFLNNAVRAALRIHDPELRRLQEHRVAERMRAAAEMQEKSLKR